MGYVVPKSGERSVRGPSNQVTSATEMLPDQIDRRLGAWNCSLLVEAYLSTRPIR
jgi:hypothetical protein